MARMVRVIRNGAFLGHPVVANLIAVAAEAQGQKPGRDRHGKGL
jgi:hypothetical protein